MKVIYLGTPDFAILPLKRIIESGFEVVAVISQPDRPQGRRQLLTKPPLADFALSRGLKVFQWENINDCAIELKNLSADIMVTCAYGQILKSHIIDICLNGILNIHASLLPKYRGAAPVQWAVIKGDKQTGITIMRTDIGLDTGDILYSVPTDIKSGETAGELLSRLSALGGDAIVYALNLIKNGNAFFTPQDSNLASKVKTIKKTDALIDFNRSAEDIVNLVRGMNPWPVAYTYLNGQMLKIYQAEKLELASGETCGKVLFADEKNGLIISAGVGCVSVLSLQLAGGKVLSVKDFIRGGKIVKGTVLGS